MIKIVLVIFPRYFDLNMILLYIVIIVLIIIFVWAMFVYNHLVSKKNKYLQAKGSIDIYLKKRFDLIPNLITIVSRYLEHEKDVFSQISILRNGMSSNDIGDIHQSSEKLSELWSGLHITNESYPDLKSNEQFLNLQKTLEKLENQISAARRAYNATIHSYNNLVQMFPASIIARKWKFDTQDFLEPLV